MVLDCIDSWSLLSFLLYTSHTNIVLAAIQVIVVFMVINAHFVNKILHKISLFNILLCKCKLYS